MNVTEKIIQYVNKTNYDDIPQEVISVQKRALIDGLAVMMGATTMGEGCSAFIGFAEKECESGECTLIGSGKKASVLMAALANGSLSHALDFEDAHDYALVHSNAVAIPAILAVAEKNGNVSGKEALAAMVLASDIACRVALGLNEDLLQYGWYMPPIHGSIGASLAVAKILGLDETGMLDALSLNINQVTCSGELLNSPKSVMRSVRDGFAAKGAVLSGLLAKEGVAARFDKPLEGKLGFYHAYANDNYEPDRILSGLGSIYESAQISFKPWPCCRGTHPSLEGIFAIINEHDLKPEDIYNIHIVISRVNEMLFSPREIKYKPATSIDAKFSMPFTISAAVHNGSIGLDTFLPDALQNEEILNFTNKITYEVDKSIGKEESLTTVITVTSSKGAFSRKVTTPKGNKNNPMSDDELNAKFRNCVKFAKKPYSEKQIDDLLDMLNRLEECEDIRDLMTLL